MPRPPAAAPVLSTLESRVMDIVWRRGSATAEDVLRDLGGGLTNASVRTILRRIEAKGMLTHELSGRTFVYRPTLERQAAARGLLRRVIDRFYGGSAEALVLGLLDGKLLDRRKLDRLARQVDRARGRERRRGNRA
jgi:predicted transcriptional regulator